MRSPFALRPLLRARLLRLGVPIALAGCAVAPPPSAGPAGQPAKAPPLPALPVEQTAELRRPGVSPPPGGAQTRDLGPPVTLAAANVSVRALLPALAEAAGISLVLGPAIEGTVSVNLQGVPALEALHAVLEEAGLGLVSGPPAALWGPVVFYPVPVNVNDAPAEVLRARFGVSWEMAEFIVQNRKP